jgi:hypothetical protein
VHGWRGLDRTWSIKQGAGDAGVRRAEAWEGGRAMRYESVGITWGEVMTAVLTLGIVTFLWLM